MSSRLLACILILCIGCQSASKTAQMRVIAGDNKDVVILSYLVSDYLQKTGNTKFNLSDLAKFDSSQRVTRNFSSLEVGNWPNVWRGGYTVYFKFSNERNKDSARLLQCDRIPWKVKTTKKVGSNKEQLAATYDGEIHFYYPERFYHVAGILLKEPAK